MRAAAFIAASLLIGCEGVAGVDDIRFADAGGGGSGGAGGTMATGGAAGVGGAATGGGSADTGPGAIDWALVGVTGEGDTAVFSSVARRPDGGAVVFGDFRGTLTVGGESPTMSIDTGQDLILVEVDAEGGVERSERYGDVGNQRAGAVAVTPSNEVVVVGTYDAAFNFSQNESLQAPTTGRINGYVSRFASSGLNLWSARIRALSDDPSGFMVTSDGDGNSVIYAHFAGTADIYDASGVEQATNHRVGSTTEIKRVMWSVSPEGEVRWIVELPVAPQHLLVDGFGRIVLCGFTSLQVNFGGSDLVPVASNDIYVAVLDPTGFHLASVMFGSMESDTVAGCAASTDGSIYLTGGASPIDFGNGTGQVWPDGTQENGKGYIAKLDTSLEALWAEPVGHAIAFHVSLNEVTKNPVFLFDSDGIQFGTDAYGGIGLVAAELSAADASPVWGRFYPGAFYGENAGTGDALLVEGLMRAPTTFGTAPPMGGVGDPFVFAVAP